MPERKKSSNSFQMQSGQEVLLEGQLINLEGSSLFFQMSHITEPALHRMMLFGSSDEIPQWLKW